MVPQTTEKNAYCVGEQILICQSLITEKIVEDVFGLPKERVQNRVTHTGKVFTVRHYRGDQAGAVDTLGLNIKGLDK